MVVGFGTPGEAMLKDIGRYEEDMAYLYSLVNFRAARNTYTQIDPARMVSEVVANKADVAVAFAPDVARYVKDSSQPLRMNPVPDDTARSDGQKVPQSFDQSMGVRRDDQASRRPSTPRSPRLARRSRRSSARMACPSPPFPTDPPNPVPRRRCAEHRYAHLGRKSGDKQSKLMRHTNRVLAALLGLGLASAGLAALAQPSAGPSTGITFRNTVTGEELNVSEGKEGGRDTPAVKEFFPDRQEPLHRRQVVPA